MPAPAILGTLKRWSRGLVYLILDEFTTPDDNPVTSPRTCEPGPGTITVPRDAEGKLSISGGNLVFGDMTTAGWDRLGVKTMAVTRAPGVALVVSFVPSVGALAVLGFHIGNTTATYVGFDGLGLYPHTSTVFYLQPSAGAGIHSGQTWVAGTEYTVAIVLMATGRYIALRVAGQWLLLLHDLGGAVTPLYGGVSVYDSVLTCPSMRVLDLTDPANANTNGVDWSDPYGLAIVRDTFTDTNGVALAAHTPETGGPWTVHTSALTVQSNAATSPDTSGATVDAANAGVLVTMTVTGTPAADVQLLMRYTDVNNHWQLHYTGTALQLREVTGGVTTSRGSTTTTLANGDMLLCRLRTTDIRCYKRAAAGVYSALTAYTSASHQTATRHGFQTIAAAPVTDFTVYPIDITGSLPEGL